MLQKYGFRNEESEEVTSDSRNLEKTTDWEDEPVVQAYIQKLNKVNELEDHLMALKMEKTRAREARDEERELNGQSDEEEPDENDPEYEELVRSLAEARAELEEFRSNSGDPVTPSPHSPRWEDREIKEDGNDVEVEDNRDGGEDEDGEDRDDEQNREDREDVGGIREDGEVFARLLPYRGLPDNP
ncbi:hypothetical protein DV736_g5592, partial [Chaetothyriales sp. CBS 134916]